eukprot:m.879397 g.879397  ORF g.879397 m.879397 type:complete len:97 (+) comp23587_c1_seq80:1104-1394(+)
MQSTGVGAVVKHPSGENFGAMAMRRSTSSSSPEGQSTSQTDDYRHMNVTVHATNYCSTLIFLGSLLPTLLVINDVNVTANETVSTCTTGVHFDQLH